MTSISFTNFATTSTIHNLQIILQGPNISFAFNDLTIMVFGPANSALKPRLYHYEHIKISIGLMQVTCPDLIKMYLIRMRSQKSNRDGTIVHNKLEIFFIKKSQ